MKNKYAKWSASAAVALLVYGGLPWIENPRVTILEILIIYFVLFLTGLLAMALTAEDEK